MGPFFSVSHTGSLVWLFVDFNNFCYYSLVNFTVSAQFRLHLWEQSELISATTIYILVSTIPCTLVPTLFFYYLFLCFLLNIYHVYCLNGSCTCHQIYHTFFALYFWHHQQYWPYLVILSFDLLMIQDSRLLKPST